MPVQSTVSARDAFEEAVGLLKARNFDGAEQRLTSALADFSTDANLLRLLGVCYMHQQRFAEAEQKLTHAIRLVSDFAKAHENLAEALLHQGKVEEGIQSLKNTLRHNPGAESATRKLSEVLAMVGRGQEADEVFEHLLEKDPDRGDLVKAMEHSRNGDVKEAEKLYRSVLRRNPENVDAVRLMGVLCAKKENYSDAEAFFRRAIELEPDFFMAWFNLGAALNEQQKFDEAEDAYKQALKIKPDSVHALEKLGANSLNDGRHDDAIDWLQKALAIDKRHFPSLLCLGHALKTVGKQAEAIDAYRQCAASKPDFGEVYWSLANLKTFRFEDAEVDEMKQHLDKVSENPAEEDTEISFCFALGKAFEDRKDYKTAYQYYARGNEKKRMKVDYDPIDFQKTNSRIIDVFSKDFFAAREGQGCTDDSPILIVGLPRSGSTLLEQILASHPDVEGTAELHYLLRIARETGLNRADGIRYPEYLHELQPHQVEGLGREYVESTLRHRSGTRYFTDKMPNNFTGVGFLHTILPNAKVIDARRHPLDSCFGSFKQLFARGQIFTYDFYDLAHYYSQYVRMMDHWNDVLPGKVLTVNYEDVVADLETQVRRIAEHCELEWDDRMLRFHETERAVKTASSEQVRQPIYSGSVDLWRRFEDDLQELIEYIEPVLMRLPEERRPRSLQNTG